MSTVTGSVVGLLYLAVFVLLIAGMWRVFSKAGQPGWAAIVPFFNTLTLLRVVGRPWYWLLLMFIPIVNLVLLIIVFLDLAKSFGKSTGFGVCTIFFSFVTIPMLGFGDAVYRGPAAAQQLYPGQPYPGQYPPGQPYPGQQYPPAQHYPGQYPPAQPYPGQPGGGNPYAQPSQYPGQQYPGQQYPGQQYSGQQYPGRQYPGQQYPPR